MRKGHSGWPRSPAAVKPRNGHSSRVRRNSKPKEIPNPRVASARTTAEGNCQIQRCIGSRATHETQTKAVTIRAEGLHALNRACTAYVFSVR